MTVRLALGCALAASVLLAGCQSATDGRPVAEPLSPTEPSFPTARPTHSSTPAPPTTSAQPAPGPPTSAATPGGEVLRPQNGYVFIETRSGKTRCQLSAQDVGCESEFTNAPVIDGLPANGVRVTADGRLEWVLGNLGAIPAVTLDYRTYSAVGWTIEAGSSGTRFTNDRSRHGMVVSVDGAQAF